MAKICPVLDEQYYSTIRGEAWAKLVDEVRARRSATYVTLKTHDGKDEFECQIDEIYLHRFAEGVTVFGCRINCDGRILRGYARMNIMGGECVFIKNPPRL